MSAGGVERVLRGLSEAFLEIPEARDWDITLLLARFNSAHRRVEWPSRLTGPNLRVEWLEGTGAVGRAVDLLAHAQGVPGLPFTRVPGYWAARELRRHGPSALRALLGDPRALVERAGARFDVLYLHYPFWVEPPPIRCPVVTTPTDFNFKFFAPEGSRERRENERALRGWLARSDRLLTSSRAMEAELRGFYPDFAGKSRVVRLGVTTGIPRAAHSELADCRARLGLPPDFALVTGWVMPHKNSLTVIRAAGELRRSGRRLPIVFAGPNSSDLVSGTTPRLAGPYLESVRAAMRDAALEPGRDVLGVGHVSDEDLRCLFQLATAFVFPSLYEGFGLPSLEATLAGCPTIVSRIPALLEQDEVLGGIFRTFDPNDASSLATELAWVLDHREEALAAARTGSERVAAHYDWRDTARAYLASFGEVVESTPRR